MHYWIVKYWEGFAKRRCLVIADDGEVARRLFLEKLSHLRDYNIRKVVQTSSTIFPLSGADR